MILLTIAGFDPSAGAGALLDARAFRALGFDPVAVLTAVTAQNTSSVTRIEALPSRLVLAQYAALARDLTLSGIKIGMIGSIGNLGAMSRILGQNDGIPRVVDPVLRSSSGTDLIGRDAVPLLLKAIRKRASVLTPNLPEAARLSGHPVRGLEEMEAAAAYLYDRTAVPCLVKGGHLKGDAVDVLFDGRSVTRFRRPRLPKSVHGTGCLFSSALLAYLVKTGDLRAAADLAGAYTHKAIGEASPIGRGRDVFQI